MVMKHRASDKSDQKTVPPKPVCQLKRAPVAPPVYRPQPTPRVLQRKQAAVTPPKPAIAGPTPRVAQPKTISKPAYTHGPRGVIQRMEGRPKRSTANYDFNYSANAPSDIENLSAFVRKAKANISALKRGATVQPERNLPLGQRTESTKAYIFAKAMALCVGEGSSGGNQHGEIEALDGTWKPTMQGYQYYFVCDGGKPSCFLCTAIASLLKIAVAATDESTYGDYVAPVCLQTNDDLWKSFVGDEAFELWQSFGETRRSRLRTNLGWVHDLGLYWQG